MIALLDADILVYRVGFTAQKETEGLAQVRMDETILTILNDLKTKDYQAFLSPTGRTTWRYRLYPDYKANRKAPKPVHYECLRSYLQEAHNALVGEDDEADDLLGLELTEKGSEAILVSIDKDLNQIPGWHYNFVTKIKYFMDPIEAMKCFYIQLLMGDASDNIPGIPKVGIVGATNLIDPCISEEEMFTRVREQYNRAFGQDSESLLQRNGQLLKIKGTKPYLWESK